MRDLLIVVSLLFFTSCGQRTVLPDRLNGDWLNKTLLDTLLATRSLYKATNSPSSDISNLNINNRGINGLYGFHSSLVYSLENLCVTDKPYVFTVKSKTNDTIYILDKDSSNMLMFSFFEHDVFIRMKKPIEIFINDIVIVGNYQDKLGSTYYFKSDGSTNWPKSGFRYELCIDYDYMIQKDCIMFSDSLNPEKVYYYGYSWKDSILRFHKEIDYPDPENTPEDYKDFKTDPFIELERI